MRDTQNILHITTAGSEGFEIIVADEDMTDTVEWAKNGYYKGRITAFWVNGVKFEEPEE